MNILIVILINIYYLLFNYSGFFINNTHEWFYLQISKNLEIFRIKRISYFKLRIKPICGLVNFFN